MGVYIKNWSLADWKELLKWAKIGANNAMIGELSEVEEVPPHGRLGDLDALRKDWLENGENEYVYDTNAFLESIDNQPTVIPAEFGGTESK